MQQAASQEDAGPSESLEQPEVLESRREQGAAVASVLSIPSMPSNSGKKRGIIYLSRIPPGMKPQKVRHMLSEYGEIGRLYLAPEGNSSSKKKGKRKQSGAKAKAFTEGWVEFEDKRIAKQVAACLNGHQMGGKRRSRHHFDLWSMKYLPKFKWEHLTEEIAYQRAVRDQKMAAEVAAANKERDFYLSRVDKAKAIEAQQERKRKRGATEPDAELDMAAALEGSKKLPKAALQDHAAGDEPTLPADVLALIAGSK